MYRDKITGQYPISKQELIARSIIKNISLPAAWTDEVLEILGVDYVKPVARPEITATQRIVEGRPEQREDGQWYQTWEVTDLTHNEAVTVVKAAVAAASSAIQTAKTRARDAGFLVDGKLFDSDQSARTAYLELANMLTEDASYTTPWKASPGVWVTMDAALYAKVKVAGTAHVSACFSWQAERDAELAAIQTSLASGSLTPADALVAVAAVATTCEVQA
jgi:hypothetical protein